MMANETKQNDSSFESEKGTQLLNDIEKNYISKNPESTIKLIQMWKTKNNGFSFLKKAKQKRQHYEVFAKKAMSVLDKANETKDLANDETSLINKEIKIIPALLKPSYEYLKNGKTSERRGMVENLCNVLNKKQNQLKTKMGTDSNIMSMDEIKQKNIEIEESKKSMSKEDLEYALDQTTDTINFFIKNKLEPPDPQKPVDKAPLIDALEEIAKIKSEFSNDKLPNVELKLFTKTVIKAHRIATEAIDKCGGSKGDMADAFAKALNYGSGFKSVGGAVDFVDNKMMKRQFESKQKPANEMDCFSYLKDKNGQRGVSSNDLKTDHLMNAWESSLSTKDKDGNEKVLFKAVRHGNTRGKATTTEELVRMLAYSNIGKEKLESIAKEKDPSVEMNISSMQLLSENFLGDKNMAEKQIKELKKWKDDKHKIFIPIIDGDVERKVGVTVKIKNLLTFNVGCNLQHLKLPTVPYKRKRNEDNNRDSLKSLFGSGFEKIKVEEIKEGENVDWIKQSAKWGDKSIIGEYLRRDDRPEKEKRIVVQLSKQIINIWVNNKHNQYTVNPYAIQSRLLYLSSLIGFATAFNCKSGKDRTGICDAETKYLAESADANGNIPDPYEDVNPMVKFNLSNMVKNGGALDVTKACTSTKGLKIVNMLGFGAIEDRAGSINLASANEATKMLHTKKKN